MGLGLSNIFPPQSDSNFTASTLYPASFRFSCQVALSVVELIRRRVWSLERSPTDSTSVCSSVSICTLKPYRNHRVIINTPPRCCSFSPLFISILLDFKLVREIRMHLCKNTFSIRNMITLSWTTVILNLQFLVNGKKMVFNICAWMKISGQCHIQWEDTSCLIFPLREILWHQEALKAMDHSRFNIAPNSLVKIGL